MILQTVVRDCLYLNWALPVSAVPPLPGALRYDMHPWREGKVVFASALLFRQERLHLARIPLVSLSYPQFNLRLYVLDHDGVPAVLFRTVLVPGWVVPSMRVVADQPAQSGQFDYPRPSRSPDDGAWRWQVKRGGELRVLARQGSPAPGHGPTLGSWERLTRFFNQRRRGYFEGPAGLKRIDASHAASAFWPLQAEVEASSLLDHCLPLVEAEWPLLHSAFLCPEIPFVFELGEAEEPLVNHAASPVAADPATFAAARRLGQRAAL
jgi:hypothetical protein